MGFKSRIFLFFGVIAGVVGLTAFLVDLFATKAPPPHQSPSTGVSSETQEQQSGEQSANSSIPSSEVAVPAGEAPTAVTRESSVEGPLWLKGLVQDAKTLQAIPAFHLTVIGKKAEGGGYVRVIDDTVHTTQGRFELRLEEEGDYSLTVRSARYLRHYQTGLVIRRGAPLEALVIQLRPGLSIAGRVVDEQTEAPVAGALIMPADGSYNCDVLKFRSGMTEHSVNAVSDESGHFVLHALGAPSAPGSGSSEGGNQKEVVLAAVHPDYTEGSVKVRPGTEEMITIRLTRGGPCVWGYARDDQGAPIEGLRISLLGEVIPLARPVLTAADGSYRTPPVRPGQVFLIAERSEIPGVGPTTYATERRSVQVAHEDVRVDFGTGLDHVTWSGVLRDSLGEPVSGLITLRPVALDYLVASQCRQLLSGHSSPEGGQFKIQQIPLGRYHLSIYLPAASSNLQWGTMEFSEPGHLQQDLQIFGAVIQGQVVEKSTGVPISGAIGNVSAVRKGGGGIDQYRSGKLDDAGRFEIVGLQAGTHTIRVYVRGYPQQTHGELELGDNDHIQDLRVEVEAGGTMLLRVTGFDEEDEVRNFEVHTQREGAAAGYWGPRTVPQGGDFEQIFELLTGNWTITLPFGAMGTVQRSFVIAAGESSEVVVDRSELGQPSGTLTVAGTVTHPDGTPASKVRLFFYVRRVVAVDEDDGIRRGVSDAEGKFSIAGFDPGAWRAKGTLPGKGEVVFEDLVIPNGGHDPYRIDLVVPVCEVSGTLSDAFTGLPFEDDKPKWWVFVLDASSGRAVAELQGGHFGSDFEFGCLPEGRLRLKINARGYVDYQSEEFFTRSGRRLELGDFALDPCGTLDLWVLDAGSRPVPSFRLFCDGQWVNSYESTPLEEGGVRFFKLTPGKHDFRIEASGLEDAHFVADLPAGSPAERTIRLVQR